MSEFMLASCEAEKTLRKGDTITANGVDYVYEEVSDWAYLYSDKGDRIDPLEVTHVNGDIRRFGIDGVVIELLEYAKAQIESGTFSKEGLLELKESMLQELETLYYNTEHPDYKAMVKRRIEGYEYNN